MPFKTSRSSNDIYNPLIKITDSSLLIVCWVFCLSIELKILYPIGYLNYNIFFNKYQEHRQHYCLVCCFSNTACSLRSIKSFVTSYDANGESKNNGFC